jgi:hypothetical protein
MSCDPHTPQHRLSFAPYLHSTTISSRLQMDLSRTSLLSKAETYSSESGDEERQVENTVDSLTNHHLQNKRQFISTTTKVITIFLAIWGSVSLCLQLAQEFQPVFLENSALQTPDVYRPDTLEPNVSLCDCGSSISEAFSRSCVYDTLATAWLPPYCRDDELTAEFDRSGPGLDGSWPYFADKDGKIPINKSQIAALGPTEGSFWSSRDWHVAHCFFYWQKYIRMRDTGAVMEKRFDMIEHVQHCGRLAMNKRPNHTLLIEVPVMMNSRIIEP